MSARIARIAWAVFALEIVGVLAWARLVDTRSPELVVDAAVGSDGKRFGKTESERQAIFRTLVAPEPQERAVAETQNEKAVWNRNHDDYFHQSEWRRVMGIAGGLQIPQWMAWAILDEGFRAHWTPPPGVTLYADDAPLARTTAPLEKHHVIAPAPPGTTAPTE